MRYQMIALTLAIAVTSPTFAGDNGLRGGKKAGHRGVFCPHCGEACYPTVTKGKETRHYFEVEAKEICIPKVRFPWEAGAKGKVGGKDGCATPKCGHLKTVHVLVKQEYECSVCKYSWDPDSFKNGKGNDKYKSGPTPAVNGSEVAPPPPVEARQQIREPSPVRFESPAPSNTSTTSTRKRTYAEILAGFFK